MDITETNVRESLLDTLSFLASEERQLDFASKVFYEAYQEEWACWWFDAFSWEDSVALNIFSPSQLALVKQFTKAFDYALDRIGVNRRLTIAQLQAKPEWKTLVAKAMGISEELKHLL